MQRHDEKEGKVMSETTKNEEIVTKVRDRYARIAELGDCGCSCGRARTRARPG